MESLTSQIKSLIKEVASSMQTVAIYDLRHPIAQDTVAKLYEKFMLIFARIDEVRIGLVEDELFFGKEIFFDLTAQVKDFIRILKEKQIEYIKFKKGLSPGELSSFLEVLSVRKKEDSSDSADMVFEAEKFSHIEVGTLGVGVSVATKATTDKEKAAQKKSLVYFNNLYENFFNKSQDILNDAVNMQDIDYPSLSKLVSKVFDALASPKNLLFTLLHVKKHHDYTFVHCLNVSVLTMFQARNLGLSKEIVVKLGKAGFLHDIGKIVIKKNILDKKEALSDEEFKKIKNHVIFGCKLLLKNPNVDKLSLIANFQHHIGFNLKGYPKVKFFKKPNLASQLISISDVYDALRTRRSYRENIPLERVYEIMQKEKGRLFDPYLLDFFFKNLGVWPVGTLVRLDSQEIGLVKENNLKDAFRPRIEIFYDDKEDRLDNSFTVDLTDKDPKGNFKRRILRHLSPYGEGQKYIAELFGKPLVS
ncbi:MAG: HD domain-containing protein [Candidatus Omnitrophica bacterium]|nr:HD domain-containing protein [Candidatus Omnitrophota bacterium]